MALFDRTYRKNISSDKLGRQIIGALFQWRAKPFWAFVLLVTPLSVGLSRVLSPDSFTPCLLLMGLNLLVWLVVKVCHTLTDLFSLKRNDNGMTVCQIIILASIGFWIVGFMLIFDIRNDGRMAAALGVIAMVLGWIFQDRVKGVAAFLHLRKHHLLNLGDWIRVPKLGVDGEVKKVTLTTITLYNWDTTTSTIPINALQSEHFMNLQHMAQGKTYGRQLLKSFILDTTCIHPIDEKGVKEMKSGKHGIQQYLPEDELKAGALNAHLYRLYLHHWLMSHPCISHRPRLFVRWAEQDDNGLRLEVHVFITDSDWSTFEWQQSQIVEHIITSMEWFGLRLYQRPSAYDFNKEDSL
ncbi:MAG: mechanosensitive ion channel [Bacteroidales bacterium]|nr:mechanosensitive ion channel [Bacteroidales bacterium]